MKVLKFGGTSVGSANSILSLKSIVEAAAKEQPVIVVVSALGGITDKLIETARMACSGDEAYRTELDLIVARHRDMVDAVITSAQRKADLNIVIEGLFDQLRSIYYGVYLIRDLSQHTLNAIVSYGEQLSSNIVAALVDGAVWLDSRRFVKTERKGGKDVLDSELTNRLIRQRFSQLPRISLLPGFISSDRDTGETTNLGRGGSDYTAAIVAAALDASILEIWTDVDGFMTADPRVIRTAYAISELSYAEATELCNFGAKVVYPPTIYPVCVKNIPILIKNTFNPSAPGSVIKAQAANDGRLIRGISSIKDTALITVSGLSMVGVIGVNRRIFTALADNGISVFFVSQASSENSTSIGVLESDADKAADVLNEEFAKEIATGSMFPMRLIKGLATVAIVGENMRHRPGVAGKLFGTLGRSGISVIATAMGASETNVSFVIESGSLRKALNVLHDSFFLSEYNVLNVFICGVGTVGSMLIEQIRGQYEQLKQTRKLKLNVVGIANSRKAIFDPNGIDLGNYRKMLDEAQPCDTVRLGQEIVAMNIFNSVFVDCTASQSVSEMYQQLLEHNVSVVAANKIAASSDYANYQKLKDTALAKSVKFRFETNVGAGLPIIGTINDLRGSGDKILKIEAVLSGTLNYIFNNLAQDAAFSKVVRQACEKGYAEPDPRIDLSGKDVVRKLVILAREAGYAIEQADVEITPLLAPDMFQGSMDDFWAKAGGCDGKFDEMRQQAEREGKRLRFVATLDQGKASVALQSVGPDHPFYALGDSNNIVLITTERYHEYPMQIKGYGAGAGVTAAGVFANILSIANI